MATQVVLPREGAPTPGVVAHVGLGPVGVVGRHVGLKVELPSEGARALGASVLATRVVLLRRLVTRAGVVVGVVGRYIRVGLSTSLEVLGRHITVDEAGVGATTVVRRRLGLDVVPVGTNVFKTGGDIEERVGGRVSIC